MTIFIFLAGLFAGTTALLAYVVHILSQQVKTEAAERKLWTNKALIRDGQTKLFSDADIAGVVPEKPEKMVPITMSSPFRRGKAELANRVAEERRAEAGSRLTPEIKQALMQDIAEMRKSNGA